MFGLINESLSLLLVKGIILLFIFFYLVFSFIMYTHTRSLGTVLTVTHSNVSRILNLLFLIHLILVLSLFFIALAIL